MSKLALSRLTKRFGEVVAVRDLHLEVPEGKLLTLLGASGCGKTTTLRMIAGLERPSEGVIDIGEVRVFGGGRTVPAERRQIGMVFQSYAIWPHLSVQENVAYPLRIARVPRSDRERRVKHTLDVVQLGHLAERYPSALSGGQQQRVALARAIVADPRLLLFDEPLSNLDVKLRERMRREIRELQQRLRVTTVYVTHDQQEALAISDFVAVMHEGNIVQLAAPQEIYENPVDQIVADFVGWTNFLGGTVDDEGTLQIDGQRFSCRAGIPARAGTSIVLACRPEDVEIGSEPDEGTVNTLPGRLIGTFYAGRGLLCDINVGGRVIQGYAAVDKPRTIGESVGVRFPPEATRCFPADG